MSHFACEHCGAAVIDSPLGYVTGCPHYPMDINRRTGSGSITPPDGTETAKGRRPGQPGKKAAGNRRPPNNH